MENWLNVEIRGGGLWPEHEKIVMFGGYSLLLKPATKDYEQSIHLKLTSSMSHIEGNSLINRFLSLIAWWGNSGMEALNGCVGTCPSRVRRNTVRPIGSSVDFPNGLNHIEEKKAQLALALYREGLIINSIPFKFLSFFKVLNIFWKDKFIDNKNELIEELRSYLPAISDQLSVERINDIKKTEKDVSQYLYQSGRCAIAHANMDPIVDPDDITDLRRISLDTPVIQAVAFDLIKNLPNMAGFILS